MQQQHTSVGEWSKGIDVCAASTATDNARGAVVNKRQHFVGRERREWVQHTAISEARAHLKLQRGRDGTNGQAQILGRALRGKIGPKNGRDGARPCSGARKLCVHRLLARGLQWLRSCIGCGRCGSATSNAVHCLRVRALARIERELLQRRGRRSIAALHVSGLFRCRCSADARGVSCSAVSIIKKKNPSERR